MEKRHLTQKEINLRYEGYNDSRDYDVYGYMVTPENGESEDEIFAWCRENISSHTRSWEDYHKDLKAAKSIDLSHEDGFTDKFIETCDLEMSIMCHGWYSFIESEIEPGSYEFYVIRETVD